MTYKTLNRVNCLRAVYKVSPQVLGEFTKNLGWVQTEGGGKVSVGLTLKEGSLGGAAKKAEEVATEAGVIFSRPPHEICLDGVSEPPKPVPPEPRKKQPLPSPPPKCSNVEISVPSGTKNRADVANFVVYAPFEIRWTPDDCEANVELISEAIGITSGKKVGGSLGIGETLIRLVEPSKGGVLAEKWVTIQPLKPIVHVSGSEVQLVGENGKAHPLSVGEHEMSAGDYKLSPPGTQKWNLKHGSEYWVHLEALPAPALVQLMPPTSPAASLTVDGTTLGGQRELTVSEKKLKLSLADNHDEVADVSVEPGPKGGVKLQLEPVARRPSYAPAWVGGGSAMIASLVWALWLHPAFSDAQDHYNNLGPTADFVSARSDMNTKSTRANVTLGVVITSLGVGLAVEAWELWRVKR